MQGYKWFFRAAAVLVVSCLTVGCGGSKQAPPSAPQAAPEVSAAGILVTGAASPEEEKLKTAVEHALLHAGYRVVASPEEVHELVAQIDVQLSEKTSIITLYVNGKPKKNYAAYASFSILGGQQLLGSETLEYDVSDGPSTGDVATLVNAFSNRQVASYVVALEQKQAKVVAEQKTHDDAKEGADNPAVPAQQRKDDTYWNSSSGWADCKSAPTRDACAGVELYLIKYPSGLHRDAARTLLKNGGQE